MISTLKSSIKITVASLFLLSSALSYAQDLIINEPKKRGFAIEVNTASQYCKELGSKYTSHGINSTRIEQSQSVAIRIGSAWALTFPGDVDTVVKNLTCIDTSISPTTKTVTVGYKSDPTNGLSARIVSMTENAQRICVETAGYPNYVSMTYSYYANSSAVAGWNSGLNHWSVQSIPFPQSIPMINTVTCSQ